MVNLKESLGNIRQKVSEHIKTGSYYLALKTLHLATAPFIPGPDPYDLYKIHPYDESVSRRYSSEYVNASFVPTSRMLYIASQLPRPEFRDRFSSFLVCSDTRLILALCKDTSYLPGQFALSKRISEYAGRPFISDEMHGCNGHSIRKIHCLAWNDHSVMKADELEFLTEYVEAVVAELFSTGGKAGRQPRKPPCGSEMPRCLIHCRAGVGRTGTYIAYGMLREYAREHGAVSAEVITDVLIHLRMCRPLMVEDICQLKFLVECFQK